MKDVYDTFLKCERMNKRQTTILDLLSKSKKIEVSSLALMLDVSQVTIRKDLDALEKSGIIIREHGYAVLNDSDDINTRLAYHYEIKQKIARKAAETIHDGETLMIESGSCCSLLALEIAKTKQEVTLITNSAFIAEYVRRYKNIHVILLGENIKKNLRSWWDLSHEIVPRIFMWINYLLERMDSLSIQALPETIICVQKPFVI